MGGAAALAPLAAALWWCWPSLGDPLSHLPVATAPLRAVEETVERAEGRLVRRLTLDAGALGRARLAISLPEPISGDAPVVALPVLFVMGGLGAGEGAIRHAAEPGANAVVGFGYPIPRRAGHGPALLPRVPELRRQVFVVPGLAAAALAWVRAQPWADPARVTPVGVSLGALFMPAVLRLDRAHGAKAGPTVLAYGGADIALLAANWARLPPALDWIRPAIGHLAALGLRPVEPAEHLRSLAGEFLVLIGGERDALVPLASAQLFAELTPEPKTVKRLPGGHIGGETDATRRTVEEVRVWLVARGAASP